MPFRSLAGFPLRLGADVLAFEHDDVSVVFVDLAVCVRAPEFLDFQGCVLLLFCFAQLHYLHYIYYTPFQRLRVKSTLAQKSTPDPKPSIISNKEIIKLTKK